MTANDDYLKSKGIELQSRRVSQRNTSAYAAAAGRAYGDKIGLTRQVGGGSNKKQLT